jgi:hypothetical protein
MNELFSLIEDVLQARQLALVGLKSDYATMAAKIESEAALIANAASQFTLLKTQNEAK